MKNTMILTPEQEQTRKEREQAIESLKAALACQLQTYKTDGAGRYRLI